MADNNGQNRDDRDNIEEFGDDPALTARVRQEIAAALTPSTEEGGFSSRRAQIMAQLRAERDQRDAPTGPISLTDRQTSQPTERFNLPPRAAAASTPNGGEPTQRFVPPLAASPTPRSLPIERPNRRGWFGTLAAALVVILVAGVVLITINSKTENNKSTVSQNGAASGAQNDTAQTRAAATTSAATTAATGTTVAPAAASAAQPGTTTAASATTAAATTAAMTSAAATTAASTTAAAATTASATTAASRTTVAATTAAAAASGGTAQSPPTGTPTLPPNSNLFTVGPAPKAPLPLYNGASVVTLRNNSPTGIKFFLSDQAKRYVPDQSARPQQGLADSDISRYAVSASKAKGAKADDVVTFYSQEAAKAGLTVEATVKLQDDDVLHVRWLYLGRSGSTQHIAVLIVESQQADDNPLQIDVNLQAGETGIFFFTN